MGRKKTPSGMTPTEERTLIALAELESQEFTKEKHPIYEYCKPEEGWRLASDIREHPLLKSTAEKTIFQILRSLAKKKGGLIELRPEAKYYDKAHGKWSTQQVWRLARTLNAYKQLSILHIDAGRFRWWTYQKASVENPHREKLYLQFMKDIDYKSPFEHLTPYVAEPFVAQFSELYGEFLKNSNNFKEKASVSLKEIRSLFIDDQNMWDFLNMQASFEQYVGAPPEIKKPRTRMFTDSMHKFTQTIRWSDRFPPIDEHNKEILSSLKFLRELYDYKQMNYGWETKDREFFENLLEQVEIVRADLKAEIRSARKYSKKEKEAETEERLINTLKKGGFTTRQAKEHIYKVRTIEKESKKGSGV